jgi:hypothetical protein
MAGLHAIKALLSATVRLSDEIFERHSPFSPHEIGEHLARQVESRVREDALGYYPALGFFEGGDKLDSQLLEIFDQLAWLGSSLVREELNVRLRPLFASVEMQSMQTVAYNMPKVRPSDPNAHERLRTHYTPNQFKFDVMLTMIRKTAGSDELDSYIRRVVHRHLGEAFDIIDLTNVKILK